LEEILHKTASNVTLETATWINKLIGFTQSMGGACAIWKVPAEDKIHLLADFSGGQTVHDIELDKLNKGFFIAPFEQGKYKSVHLKADLQGEIAFTKSTPGDKTEVRWKNDSSIFERQVYDHLVNNDKIAFAGNETEHIQSTSKEAYCEWVEKGINAIKKETFAKIVPSKIKVVKTNAPVDYGRAYIKTAAAYENAFVSLTVSPASGIWLGASPEILIEDIKGGDFKTVALAGTQPKTEKLIAETAWTQKEIEEQAYVSRYIINCFKKIRLRDYSEIGPRTIAAGNLLHLKTTYRVDKAAVNFPELASVMLDLIHPTSAVCGMPKAPSLDFLHKHETHDRAYFSGFLGPVHQEGKTSLYVNLRCCQFLEDQAVFYAGAGVTEDSDPEKEWNETEMKCAVLANVIFD